MVKVEGHDVEWKHNEGQSQTENRKTCKHIVDSIPEASAFAFLHFCLEPQLHHILDVDLEDFFLDPLECLRLESNDLIDLTHDVQSAEIHKEVQVPLFSFGVDSHDVVWDNAAHEAVIEHLNSSNRFVETLVGLIVCHEIQLNQSHTVIVGFKIFDDHNLRDQREHVSCDEVKPRSYSNLSFNQGKRNKNHAKNLARRGKDQGASHILLDPIEVNGRPKFGLSVLRVLLVLNHYVLIVQVVNSDEDIMLRVDVEWVNGMEPQGLNSQILKVSFWETDLFLRRGLRVE